MTTFFTNEVLINFLIWAFGADVPVRRIGVAVTAVFLALGLLLMLGLREPKRSA